MNALLELEPARRKELLNNRLRLIVSASEPLLSDIPATWMNEFKHPARHIHMIGQTETSGIIVDKSYYRTRCRPEQFDRFRSGVRLPTPKIYLLDENQQPVAPGEAGEMYVCGAAWGADI